MRRRILVPLCGVVLLAVACESGAPVAKDDREAVSPTSVGADEEGAETSKLRTVLEHGCTGKGVGPFDAEGQYPPEKDWLQQELVVGSVGFEDHDASEDRRPARYAGKEGQYRSYGFPIIVAAGKRATLKVARGKVAFQDDPGDDGADGRFRISDGVGTLRLTACDEEDTRFLEGLIVGGAQCLRLRVATGAGTEGVVDIPFATECS